MSNLGTIYVLINPVMPGLVKIGKTKRLVEERIQELSSATGVPTQFILVYEQKFINVDVAESQIHVILEEHGFRLSVNREFFNAPVAEAIKVIQSLDGKFDGTAPCNENIIDVDTSIEEDEFGTLKNKKNNIESQPWAEFWYMAENYYYGLQGEIQDHIEAMAYYVKAIKAGCPIAYIRIGEMFELGEGVSRPDAIKALEFYKKGANNGDYYCYVNMAKMYLEDGNTENARKCIDRFVTNRVSNQKELIEEAKVIGLAIYDICDMAFDSNILSHDSKIYLSNFKDAAANVSDGRIRSIVENRNGYDASFVTSYTQKLKAIKSYILNL